MRNDVVQIVFPFDFLKAYEVVALYPHNKDAGFILDVLVINIS